MDADDDVGRAARDRAVDGVDVALDQRVGIAARARNLVADRGIAEQRDRDLVDLQVAAAGLHQVGDLLREHGDEIGEEALGIGIGAARGEVGEPQEVHGRGRRQRDLGRDAGGVAQEHELVERERTACAAAARSHRAR